MSGKVSPVDSITLRVKRNSGLDKFLRLLLDNSERFVPADEFGKISTRSVAKLMAQMSKQIDNLDFRYDTKVQAATCRYTEIQPYVPVPVGKDVVVDGVLGASVSAPAAVVEDIRWPQTPPVPVGMNGKYREPSWFKSMELMVQAGRHVSLAGAPGTGKDTAVIELAAGYDKPLVFVGGDAGFRRRDLVGTQQIAGGHSFFEVAEYAAAAINGWWVCISEVNAADADALLFINQQLAAPYVVQVAGKSYPVHPDFRLFVTYNPGLIGTKPLPQSFKDRFFSVSVPWFTAAQLGSLLGSHGLPADEAWATDLIATALEIYHANERGTIRYQVTTRRLLDAMTLVIVGKYSLESALDAAIVSAIDSPVEAKTVKQIINSVKSSWLSKYQS